MIDGWERGVCVCEGSGASGFLVFSDTATSGVCALCGLGALPVCGAAGVWGCWGGGLAGSAAAGVDRKSVRRNSSETSIVYAVCFLKKKHLLPLLLPF